MCFISFDILHKIVYYQTPLHIAAANGMKDVTQFLLDEGAWVIIYYALDILFSSLLNTTIFKFRLMLLTLMVQHHYVRLVPMVI